ncbi:MAG TPA: hypothetical protein VJ654_12795 [Noviherbaspirillum sp.]|nr:hypothetical protein [Noviherbaspirillum sp.]
MNSSEAELQVLSVEFFAAKDSGEMMMTVPWNCGLKEATTLRVADLFIVAMRGQSVLPIDLPSLDEECKARLIGYAERGKALPVAEFSALGLRDAYFLNVVIA